MNALAEPGRLTLLYTALPVAGLALGAFFWLWAEHGAEVYLNYLAGVAFTCF